MDCTIYVAKTKALFSWAVTAELKCAFVFAYARIRFSNLNVCIKFDCKPYIEIVRNYEHVLGLEACFMIRIYIYSLTFFHC